MKNRLRRGCRYEINPGGVILSGFFVIFAIMVSRRDAEEAETAEILCASSFLCDSA